MTREMKNSGIDWIGQIPADWKIGRVKNAFTRKNEKAQQEEPTILSLARSGVKVRDVSTGEGQIAESYYNYNPVEPFDLLLNPMDLYSGANCSISKVSGVISPAYINLKANEEYYPVFYDYYFKTQYWAMAFFAHGKGVSYDNRWTLSAETLMNYYIPVPSFTEQKKIADFLDSKVSEIDKMIAETKSSIENYKEYKQSVIAETVTKGLNKDVLMKDSGIDWIGQVPADWEIVKIKYVSNVSRGLFNHRPRNDERYYNGAYPFIQTGDVASADKYITKYSQTLNELGKSVSKEFPKGTLTMTIAANIGDVSILGFDSYFPDSIIGFIPNENIQNIYLYYIFKAMKEQFINASVMNTQLNLNIERVREIFVPITYNQDKQKEIIDYLDTKCAEIDNLISEKEALVSNLEEYKKSLIYEYVTGKKTV